MIRLLILLSLSFVGYAVATAPATERVWVYFADKQLAGTDRVRALDALEQSLTPHARERRIRNWVALADDYDLPVANDYVEQVQARGARLRTISKWLNAVSCEATPSQIADIERLSFVTRVENFRLRPEPRNDLRARRAATDDIHYGLSDWQNELSGVPELHARGLSGVGVLMCFLDTGCQLAHEAFDSLEVIATRDFIFNDDIIADEPELDSTGQMTHGTATLSAAVGWRDSLLVGPAYGASVMIAKTEWVADEIRSEEDHYVAALEWADSMGAQVTSSSLGYVLWYDYEDLDGHTAVTTQAAVIAARHGILVVTSAGNNRERDWFYVGTPADADSILAVGAVDSFRVLAGFSSGGPTTDGRTKPDVCAMGQDVFCAAADANDRYWFLSGTSLSAPIVAGIAALVMEAHPDWTAQQIREALMLSASNVESPNNEIGWGIVSGPAAVDFEDVSGRGRGAQPTSAVMLTAFPNPVNGEITLQLTFEREVRGELALFDVTGRRVFTVPRSHWPAGTHVERIAASGLPSGELFARFASEAGRSVRRIVVLK